MENIPDDPIIASILRTGYPPWTGQDRRLGRASDDGRPGGRPCRCQPGRAALSAPEREG